MIQNIRDVVYVKPQSFDPARSLHIAHEIGDLNDQFLARHNHYILVGPGRWGSTDPWLGIPVKWPQISAARVIVESGLEHYHIDPSQGTHFFQNLTSFRVGYFTINPHINHGYYDVEYLDRQAAEYESEFIRHIRFDEPMVIKIDGRRSLGLIEKSKNNTGLKQE
jgi:hypothetical protein